MPSPEVSKMIAYRNEEIYDKYACGNYTQKKLAMEYGVTITRIQQILKKESKRRDREAVIRAKWAEIGLDYDFKNKCLFSRD